MMYPYQEGCRGARRCALPSALGGSSASALHIPLARLAGEGDTGGEGDKTRLPSRTRREQSPLPQRFCAEPLYPYQTYGGGQL